jgi:hypothetical protein
MTAHPHPRWEKKSPPLSPSMLAGGQFYTIPDPVRGIHPHGVPVPTKETCRHQQHAIKKIVGGTKVNPWYNTDIKRTSTLVDVVLLRNIAGLVLSNPKKIQRRGK